MNSVFLTPREEVVHCMSVYQPLYVNMRTVSSFHPLPVPVVVFLLHIEDSAHNEEAIHHLQLATVAEGRVEARIS